MIGVKPFATMRVSYTGITSAFQADERGSIPLTRLKKFKIERKKPWKPQGFFPTFDCAPAKRDTLTMLILASR